MPTEVPNDVAAESFWAIGALPSGEVNLMMPIALTLAFSTPEMNSMSRLPSRTLTTTGAEFQAMSLPPASAKMSRSSNTLLPSIRTSNTRLPAAVKNISSKAKSIE